MGPRREFCGVLATMVGSKLSGNGSDDDHNDGSVDEPLSIALVEVAVDKIVPVELPEESEESEESGEADGEVLLVEGGLISTDTDDEGA